jgi:molecular chaperone GrpE
MQPGYIMHERLLRPAMVGVAKGDPDSPPEDVDHIDTTA